MVFKKRSQIQKELAKKYDNNPQSIYALEMQCNAWREKLAQHLMTRMGKNPNRNVFKSAFLSAPDAPPIPLAGNPRWSQSKIMMDNSFTAWYRLTR